MSDAQTSPELIRVTIDGQELHVEPGTLVIRAAEQLGITIPRFCDHPLLDPVAACRMCLVDVEGSRKPTPACSEAVRPDMVVRTQETSELSRQYQASQMEFLLVNHPLDCPQCDKGGECPLQDQSLANGNAESRMLERKRVFTKALPINPLITLDRERCVLCARCTRFSKEISGDPFIELFERSALEQVAIYGDKPYDSYFSGNVVQICPVGALTSNSYRFGARPFDIRRVPGIAFHDASGAGLRHDLRRGEIQRSLARTNLEVNDAWLDDKNRYGHAFLSSTDRLRHPMVRGDAGSLQRVSWTAAVQAAADALLAVRPEEVAILTGGRLTDEDAYAVSRFARDVVGTDHVDFRTDPQPDDLTVLPLVAGETAVTNAAVEAAPVVVIAGLEPHEELPLLHLRLRKAWRRHGTKIVVVGPVLGRLQDIAWTWIPTEVGAEAAVLRALADGAGDNLKPVSDELGAGTVVLAGERLAASPDALPAARDLAAATGGAFGWVPRKPGARGAVEAGLLPGSLPGGRSLSDPGPVGEVWSRLPSAPGTDATGVFNGLLDGTIKVVWLIGIDPVTDFADADLARRACEAADVVILSDLMTTESVRRADIVFPVAAPPERVGSFTNWEGRRQSWPQAAGTAGQVLPDWDVMNQVARAMRASAPDSAVPDLGWETANDVRREAAPLMARTDQRAPSRATASPSTDGAATSDRPLACEPLPMLLQGGTMLAGATELLASAPPLRAWVNPADADGLADGQRVTVSGPDGQAALELVVTTGVAAGVVVVPSLLRRRLGAGRPFVGLSADTSSPTGDQ